MDQPWAKPIDLNVRYNTSDYLKEKTIPIVLEKYLQTCKDRLGLPHMPSYIRTKTYVCVLDCRLVNTQITCKICQTKWRRTNEVKWYLHIPTTNILMLISKQEQAIGNLLHGWKVRWHVCMDNQKKYNQLSVCDFLRAIAQGIQVDYNW